MEQIHGLFRAGQKADAPFIVQMTPVARNYAHSEMLLAMISAASKIYPKAVYAIHLDHGNEEHSLDAIASNEYNSVMIDASHYNFEENISRTKKIVEKAHRNHVLVEAELGVLSGVEDDIIVDEEFAKYTKPLEVEAFVKRTNCDSLAVAVGTSHGAYKFSGGQGIQFDILKEIQKKLPKFPVVLHGGSAVNKEEIKKINKNGGQLNEGAAGVAPEEIVKSIKYGVCKINIATDIRLIWTRVHREFFTKTPDLFDPIIPGAAFIDAYEEFMLEKFKLLNATGKASKLVL